MRNSSSLYPSSGIPTDSGNFPPNSFSAAIRLPGQKAHPRRRLQAFYHSLLGDEELHPCSRTSAPSRPQPPAEAPAFQRSQDDRTPAPQCRIRRHHKPQAFRLHRMLFEHFQGDGDEPVPMGRSTASATLVELLELRAPSSQSSLVLPSFCLGRTGAPLRAYATTRRPRLHRALHRSSVREVVELVSERAASTASAPRREPVQLHRTQARDLVAALSSAQLRSITLALHHDATEPLYPLASFGVVEKNLHILEASSPRTRP